MLTKLPTLLKDELARRCERNSRYSLRSFAKTLEVSPSLLSLVLNNKRKPSLKLINKLAKHFEWTQSDIFQLDNQTINQQTDSIDLKVFEKISTWLAYVILSLTRIQGFKSDFRWIATTLGVSIHEVKSSIAGLLDSGLLTFENNQWRANDHPIRINNKTSTSFTRSFQKQMLTKALDALDEYPLSMRDTSSITFVASKDKINEIKKEIRKFRLHIAKRFEIPGEADEVYNLTVQLTPATKVKI